MSKLFNKTPKQLKKEFNDFDWYWALKNVAKDKENEDKKTENILEYLQPWLNPELFKALQKDKTNRKETTNDYINSLREHGVDEDEIKEICEKDGVKYIPPGIDEVQFLDDEDNQGD